MHVAVIKKTKDLNSLSLSEILAVIKACDMDDKQLEINYANSYQSANLGVSTNSAFSALSAHAPVYQASSTSSKPMVSPVPSIPVVPAPTLPKGAEENLGLMAGLLNCYNAFCAGELVQPMMVGDLDQVHPDDVEEMDISWHIAMAVFRAKKFIRKTGSKNWVANNGEKKVGFNKTKLQCYNCHEPGHFDCECTKPRMEITERNLVPTGTNRDVDT
ncbi:hypothetical protein L2E82_18307 [Cichorium intybus]|uniref:Uncharacterized protein n=1 Tax=Cichorium intybus TaxID=13427 RepID=A0ACB9FAF8_CICIN|nr:hypothetical protein L2E82_18307 [Cichorium intybus]